MEVKKVTVEQVLAAALLKFGSVDYIDMVLLMALIKMKTKMEIADNMYRTLEMIITEEDRRIKLKPGLDFDSNLLAGSKRAFPVRRLLEGMVCKELRDFMNDLDVEFLVLKKMEFLPIVPYNLLGHYFSLVQREAVEEHIQSGSMMAIWNDELGVMDFRQLIITPLGLAKRFMSEYASDVELFKTALEQEGFDTTSLLDYFVSISQQLDGPITEILSIAKFREFDETYDQYPFKRIREAKKTDED